MVLIKLINKLFKLNDYITVKNEGRFLMKKYENIYIYTDVDGTISTWNYEMPQSNLDAIKYFVENGGHFGIATGRGKHGVRTLPCLPYINMPCILANGGVIVKMDDDKPIFFKQLPKKAREIALDIRDKYPTVPIMVWGEENRFDISDRDYCHENLGLKDTVFTTLENLTEPWAKLFFYLEPKYKNTFMEYVEKLGKDEVCISSSSANYVEVMPNGISKGEALQKIIDIYNIDKQNLLVSGDFNNDLPMLSIEGVRSFCPSNAEVCVKNVVQEVLCHVSEGIIPQMLKRI